MFEYLPSVIGALIYLLIIGTVGLLLFYLRVMHYV